MDLELESFGTFVFFLLPLPLTSSTVRCSGRINLHKQEHTHTSLCNTNCVLTWFRMLGALKYRVVVSNKNSVEKRNSHSHNFPALCAGFGRQEGESVCQPSIGKNALACINSARFPDWICCYRHYTTRPRNHEMPPMCLTLVTVLFVLGGERLTVRTDGSQQT